jgi:hypothetical protein
MYIDALLAHWRQQGDRDGGAAPTWLPKTAKVTPGPVKPFSSSPKTKKGKRGAWSVRWEALQLAFTYCVGRLTPYELS